MHKLGSGLALSSKSIHKIKEMKNLRLIAVFVSLMVCPLCTYAQMLNPLTWTVHFEPKSGSEGEIVIDAKIERGWHLYDTKLPKDGPVPTSIVWDRDRLKNVEIVGDLVPSKKAEENVDMFFHLVLGTWENSVTFRQKVRLTDSNNYNIEGAVVGQVCNDETCQRKKQEFKFSKDTPVAVNDTVPTVAAEDVAPAEKTGELIMSDYWEPVTKAGTESGAQQSMMLIFLGGLVGGLLALLTPCVWPMIPLTVSFFLKRSSNNRRKAVWQAVVYGASIVVIYLILGLLITLAFGPSMLNDMSTSAWFNVLFFVLLVVFAISFFGVFEISLPSGFTNSVNSRAGKATGILSLFLMAFTLVLVSFSCTGPIIGTLLVEAVSHGSIVGPAAGMLGFAIALAIPFTIFAIFPSWLKSLPKSGGWLNTMKVILGFIELALSLKFLSVADLAYGWHILDREVFVSLWIAISVCLGLYLLRIIRFYEDDGRSTIGAFRLIAAVVAFAFAAYLLPGLWGAPLRSVSAFAPPLSTQDFNLYKAGEFSRFDNFDEGMEAAKKVGKPVFVDFSGYGCVNCRKMEASVFESDKVKDLLENNFVVITLMTDDKKELPEMIEHKEGNKVVKLRTYGDLWSYLQQYKFRANSQPFYAVIDNDGTLMAGPYYYDEDVSKFVDFLKTGLTNYKKHYE